jgi:archaemetzincin
MIKPGNTFLSLIAILVVGSCADSDKSNINDTDLEILKPVVIDIIPYNDVPAGLAYYTFSEFKKIFPKARLLSSIPLPRSAWYMAKSRYRADSLVYQLSDQTLPGHITLALTTKEISTTYGKFKDWGVFGLSYLEKACIASNFRINGINRLEQFYKVAIHEIGHTQGLNNCKVKTCFMHDIDGKYQLNAETEFCPKCKKFLIKAGFTF